MNTYPFRTISHATCALGGRHTSEEWAMECPVLGRNAQERLAAWRAMRRRVSDKERRVPTGQSGNPGKENRECLTPMMT